MEIRLRHVFLLLISSFSMNCDVWAARTDRAFQENAQTRARVKEEYLEVQRDLRKFLGSQTEKRVLSAEKQGRLGALQVDVRGSLPLQLRIDKSLMNRGLEELFLFVDGMYWGNFRVHESSEARENVFWYFNNIKSIPVGERQLKFTARLLPTLSPSFTKDPVAQDESFEGVQSVFISDQRSELALHLELKSDFFKKISWIEIQPVERFE